MPVPKNIPVKIGDMLDIDQHSDVGKGIDKENWIKERDEIMAVAAAPN